MCISDMQFIRPSNAALERPAARIHSGSRTKTEVLSACGVLSAGSAPTPTTNRTLQPERVHVLSSSTISSFPVKEEPPLNP